MNSDFFNKVLLSHRLLLLLYFRCGIRAGEFELESQRDVIENLNRVQLPELLVQYG